MEGRWIEVGSVRPYERVRIVLERNSIEQRQVSKRPVELTFQDRREIDLARNAVGEARQQGKGSDHAKRDDAMDWMKLRHGPILSQRVDLERGQTLLKPRPVLAQFVRVYFYPGFAEA